MMQQYGVWDINISPAGRFQLQTQVYIVECYAEAFIQASNSVEFAFFNNEACGGYGAYKVCQMGQPEVTGFVCR